MDIGDFFYLVKMTERQLDKEDTYIDDDGNKQSISQKAKDFVKNNLTTNVIKGDKEKAQDPNYKRIGRVRGITNKLANFKSTFDGTSLYTFTFDMPGVEKENVEIEAISTKDGVLLSIKGNGEVGKYEATLPLHSSILAETIKASVKNGVFTVTASSLPKTKTIKIDVQEGDTK